jgi:DNA-binding NtrC family response regulator
MKLESRTILHIEDERWLHVLVSQKLNQNQWAWAKTMNEARTALANQSVEVILLDRNLDGIDSFPFIAELLRLAPHATLIVVSADADGDAIQTALAQGAHDYLIKTPQIADELGIRIEIATTARRSKEALGRDYEDLETKWIGQSENSKALREKTRKLAQQDIGVLITGESGTGKEVLASEIHRLRKDPLRPFVAINCGAISETVFESELFGHEKGAFTGAASRRDGLLKAADGGDLFLDEVGDLPKSQQVKLLRFLQDGTYTPVGSTHEQTSRVRVIAATNKDLEKEVMLGNFREDLFYRLDIYRLHTKPLRERPEDIAPLAELFVKEFSPHPKRILKEAIKVLEKQPWKGNVRELSAVIQRALVEAQGGDIRAEHIRVQNISGRALGLELPKSAGDVSFDGFENYVDSAIRAYLQTALDFFKQDTLTLAKALEMSRATLYNKINRLNLTTTRSKEKTR